MKKFFLVLLVVPSCAQAMSEPNSGIKRKVVASVEDAKKQRVHGDFTQAIAQFYQEKNVMDLCDTMQQKMILESDKELEKKLTLAKRVALRSCVKHKIYETFDIDTISLLSNYFAILKKVMDLSADTDLGFEEKTAPTFEDCKGALYTFEEGTSENVIKLFMSYFNNPKKLPAIKQEILKYPQEAFQVWYHATKLGVEPLITFVGEHMLELCLQNKEVQKRLQQCWFGDKVDEALLKKVFVDACCGGDERVFDHIFEEYYQKNPEYWDMKNPVQEIFIEDNKQIEKLTMSSTCKSLTAEIRHDCLLVYNHDGTCWQQCATVKLLHHDFKGGSSTKVFFSPDDSLCVVYEQRGLYQQYSIYDSKSWQMFDLFKVNHNMRYTFIGFTNENNFIVFCESYNPRFVPHYQMYDMKQKKLVTVNYDVQSILQPQKYLNEKEVLEQVKLYIEKLGTYEGPQGFTLERTMSDGRYAIIKFTSTVPGSHGSGIMFNHIIFDCRAMKVVFDCTGIYTPLFLPDGTGCVRAQYQQASFLPWRSAESKICFHATTLRGVVEKHLGPDFFESVKSTSWFGISKK